MLHERRGRRGIGRIRRTPRCQPWSRCRASGRASPWHRELDPEGGAAPGRRGGVDRAAVALGERAGQATGPSPVPLTPGRAKRTNGSNTSRSCSGVRPVAGVADDHAQPGLAGLARAGPGSDTRTEPPGLCTTALPMRLESTCRKPAAWAQTLCSGRDRRRSSSTSAARAVARCQCRTSSTAAATSTLCRTLLGAHRPAGAEQVLHDGHQLLAGPQDDPAVTADGLGERVRLVLPGLVDEHLGVADDRGERSPAARGRWRRRSAAGPHGSGRRPPRRRRGSGGPARARCGR